MMTALAQGSAGLALALCFALLRTRQAGTSAALLLLQSLATAVCALSMGRAALALAPLALAIAIWSIHDRTAMRGFMRQPIGGSRLTMATAAALAILCQSQGAVAEPLAILLLGILLAATRSHPLAQATALVVIQNAITVMACRTFDAPLLPVACLLLVLPVLAPLLIGYPRLLQNNLVAHFAGWIGWVRFAGAIGILLTTLIIPLDPLAAIFAPLLAFDGIIRAWAERRRRARVLMGHVMALIRVAALIVAVSGFSLLSTWIAITIAMATAVLPSFERRPTRVALAFCAAAFALFGVVTLDVNDPIGYLGLIIGFATIAALVPELAMPLTVSVLRLSNTHVWSDAAARICDCVAVVGVLACAAFIARQAGSHRVALLHLAQSAVALLAIGLNHADGRYAAMTLLVLLTLTRAASRFGSEPAAVIGRIGLSGISPIGVFPALVLVVLAVSGHGPWLLVPLGIGLCLIVPASLPSRLPIFSGRDQVLSAAWLPLAVALVFGFLAPAPFAHWLHLVTAGPS